MNKLNVIVGYELAESVNGLVSSNKRDILISPIHKSFDSDVVRNNISELIQTVVDMFEKVDKNLESEYYEVGDIEFEIRIGAEGHVSILSIAEAGVSSDLGIKIQLRRK